MSKDKRDWLFRIDDMLKSIDQIEQVVAQTNFKNFENNFILSNSIIRDLEIIGEAAKKIPDMICNQYSEIPWQDIRDMRNLLIHEYFGVNLNVVWNTAINDIPSLKNNLLKISKDVKDKE